MNTTATIAPAATDDEMIAALAASPNFVTVTDSDHLAELLGMDDEPATTEVLSDIIDRVMAWFIVSGLDEGSSLSWGLMGVPATGYRRERLSTWVREMGRPAAIAALRAYAVSPSQATAEIIARG